ncbi:hypothetical protein [Microbacterium sp. PRC9]|uniref:hypothetical protein n=1 Tax=Microbacterium sp. PRC9 TaxID=2962591 RepID=UPI002881C9ED|nr:hypothetical protein [Microbacterium sp. PRC9]MDT0143076.1 hypothetical protein [Microbacterium sp. PRC9]
MTATTPHVGHPIGVRDLPDGMTPCATCGRPCPEGTPTTERLVLGRDVGLRIVDEAHVLTFAVCPSCADRHALAAEIATQHPGFLALGSPSITADRLAAALDALAAVGATPATDAYLHSYPAARSLLERLSDLGVTAGWARQFSPIWQPRASMKTCAAPSQGGGWLFVPSDLAAEIRRALAAHVGDLRPPTPQPVPATSRYRGCVVCGVGTVTARRVSEAWTEVRSGVYAGGHLCPADARIVTEEGGTIGATVLERSACDVVDPDRLARRRRPYDPQLQGLQAWADSGMAPGPGRWSFVDLEALLALLSHGTW